MEAKKFAIIGGDKRNIYLTKELKADGHFVKTYGFSKYEDKDIDKSSSLQEVVDGVDLCIGGTPITTDGKCFNAPYADSAIYIEDVFKAIGENQVFLAGYIKKEVLETAAKYSKLKIYDILKIEELSILNAIPTAEGAVQIAIEKTDITLHDSNIMIIGYGRIGKILSNMLRAMGAKVVVVVNSCDKKALAKSYGLDAIHVENIADKLCETDIIFNTVPKIILDETNMGLINKQCLVIDLASPPFGVDFEASKKFGLNVIYTGSLPGVVAPRTVAAYIKEAIYNIL